MSEPWKAVSYIKAKLYKSACPVLPAHRGRPVVNGPKGGLVFQGMGLAGVV